MNLEPLLLREGDVIEAAGRVVTVDGEMRFEPPLPRRLMRYLPGTEPAPKFSAFGVPVSGVDLSTLADRFDKDGALEGFATLRGRWVGGALRVLDQSAFQWPAVTDLPWDSPPCPAPPGGWPHGRKDENLELPDDLVNDPAVAGLLMVRPSVTQVVLAVISHDPAGTCTRWSPVFPSRLCVVAARWPQGKVEALTKQAQSLMPEFQAYAAGPGFSAAYQPVVTLDVDRMVPALVAWAADLPDGILEVQAWLRPHAEPRGGDPAASAARR